MSLIIQTKELVKKYGSRTVVNHVSFNVKQGEIVGLLGPNGAGKTTSFYQVVGLIKPDDGDVYLNDINITKLPMYKRAKMGIGYLPQEASVFRKLSVEDNIKAVLEMSGLNRQGQKDKLEQLLNEFHLQHVRKNNGDTLSGGERRRTEIARCLAVDPKFILLDEPFAGVDPIAVEDIQAIVAKLKFRNIGILITDHNVNETLSICDRAYLLIDGKIFKHGTAEELAQDEQVRRLYLGRNFELKRKDYLHDEAEKSGNEKITAGAIKDTTTLVSFVNYVSAQTDFAIKFIGDRMAIIGRTSDNSNDLNFRDYFTSYNQVKDLLKIELQKTKSTTIKNAVDKLPELTYEKYSKLIDVNISTVLSGWVWRIFTSFKLQPLLEKLNTVKSSLEEISLDLTDSD